MTNLPGIILLSVIGVILFISSVILRSKTGNKYEIKAIDIIIATIPILLFFIATGKLKNVIIPGIAELTISESFSSAAENKIDPQKLTFSKTTMVKVKKEWTKGISIGDEDITKGTIVECPITTGIPYDENNFLLRYFNFFKPVLRYVIVTDKEGVIFGIYEAQKLYDYLFPVVNPRSNEDPNYDSQYEERRETFAKALMNGDKNALASIAQIPGFIPGKYALKVSEEVNIKNALSLMDKMQFSFLPVVDVVGDKEVFEGVVERSDVIAKMLSDIIDNIEKWQKKTQR